ncbi:hypothetical protein SGFS_103830 [Streptomyces graminofaciens]|uniref:Uncharacterized protein n=1 Tax=Streptomyces graminofaciens TaxID=68212 RepID=A0ABM7FRG5_9ACTN|nr:hypothetical protein SGFS_103830 [Streptomyces graminofaciens]
MSGDHSIGVRQGSNGIGIMDSSEATAVSTGVLASVTSGDPPVDTDGGRPRSRSRGCATCTPSTAGNGRRRPRTCTR